MKNRIIEALKFEANKDVWRSNFGSNEFKICDQLNYELFGKHFNRQKKCECIEDFFLLLKSRLNKLNFKSINMNKLFKLKPGRLVQNHAFVDGVSEFSSDADCLKLLKLNPANIKHFDEVPEGWESMEIKEEVEGSELEDWKTLSVAKIKAFALDKGHEVKATKREDVVAEVTEFLASQVVEEEVEEVEGSELED